MSTQGCYNRPPLVKVVVIRAAKGDQPEISYPFRNSPDCEFTLSELGKVDAKCAGCVWKAEA